MRGRSASLVMRTRAPRPRGRDARCRRTPPSGQRLRRVDGHRHDARRQGGDEGEDELLGLGEHQRHAIAPLHPQRQERVGLRLAVSHSSGKLTTRSLPAARTNVTDRSACTALSRRTSMNVRMVLARGLAVLARPPSVRNPTGSRSLSESRARSKKKGKCHVSARIRSKSARVVEPLTQEVRRRFVTTGSPLHAAVRRLHAQGIPRGPSG